MKAVPTNFIGTDPPVHGQDRGLTCEPTMGNRLNLQVVGGVRNFADTSRGLSPPEKLGHDEAGSVLSRLGDGPDLGTPVGMADRLKTQSVEVAMGCSISTSCGHGRGHGFKSEAMVHGPAGTAR